MYDINAQQMSYNHFRILELLGIVDTYFGIIPMTCSICNILAKNSSFTIKDIVSRSRWLMIIQEVYCMNHNKNSLDATCCNVTYPETVFFEKSVPAARLGTGFTENLLSDLKDTNYIDSFFEIKGKRGCNSVKKNQDKINQFTASKELNKYLGMFTGNYSTKIKIVGSYPTQDIEKQNITKQIELTAKLLIEFQNRTLKQTMEDIEPSIKERIGSYKNVNTIPLVGIIRTRQDQTQFVLYILNYFEYDGNQKKIENLHVELSDYTETIFNDGSTLKQILSNIHRLNKIDVDPNCYVRTMTVMPSYQKGTTKQVVLLQLFGFVKETITSRGFSKMGFDKIVDNVQKLGYRVYSPPGDYGEISLGG